MSVNINNACHFERNRMLVAKVGRRGQMTLPSEIRGGFNISEGDRVAFIRRGDELVLQPLSRTLLDIRGSVQVSGVQDFDAIRAEARANRAKKRTQNVS